MVAGIEEVDQISLSVILEEYDDICTFVRASEVTTQLANMKNYVRVVSKPYVDTAVYISEPIVKDAVQAGEEAEKVVVQQSKEIA